MPTLAVFVPVASQTDNQRMPLLGSALHAGGGSGAGERSSLSRADMHNTEATQGKVFV